MPTPSLSRPSRALAVLTTVLLAVGLAACGSDDDPTETGAGPTTTAAPSDDGYGGTGGDDDGGEAAAGTIVAQDFSLTDITVAPGAEIVLDNQGGATHTATADDDAFDLEASGGSQSDPGTAPEEPGSYPFHCEIHESMTATLTVEG